MEKYIDFHTSAGGWVRAQSDDFVIENRSSIWSRIVAVAAKCLGLAILWSSNRPPYESNYKLTITTVTGSGATTDIEFSLHATRVHP